jgi:hypothetical protein
MIIQCAWCLKMVGEKAPFEDKAVTHGICEQCQKKMMKQVIQMEQKA